MKTKLNNGHYFEVMDRANIMRMNLESTLTTHPALTKKMRKKLRKAEGLLGEVYQWAGAKHFHGVIAL